MKPTNMYIHLKGLKIYAYHGVLPQENKIGAEYTIDLQLKTDFTKAADTDQLEGTVNYAAVLKQSKQKWPSLPNYWNMFPVELPDDYF